MVDDRVTDGRRIGQLLASEIRGRETGPIGSLSVVDVRDVEGSPEGDFAYGIELEGERLAGVDVLDDRIRLTVRSNFETAVEVAIEKGLSADRDAPTPGRARVFVESGAAVKRALDVLEAVVPSSGGGPDDEGEVREDGTDVDAA